MAIARLVLFDGVGRDRIREEVALRMVDAIEAQIAPLERELRQLARRQTGCRTLMGGR